MGGAQALCGEEDACRLSGDLRALGVVGGGMDSEQHRGIDRVPHHHPVEGDGRGGWIRGDDEARASESGKPSTHLTGGSRGPLAPERLGELREANGLGDHQSSNREDAFVEDGIELPSRVVLEICRQGADAHGIGQLIVDSRGGIRRDAADHGGEEVLFIAEVRVDGLLRHPREQAHLIHTRVDVPGPQEDRFGGVEDRLHLPNRTRAQDRGPTTFGRPLILHTAQSVSRHHTV